MTNNSSLSSASVYLPHFGLYFPYIHFRDDSWVKVAALYWPKMVRIVPIGYPTRDSETVRALSDKLNWTINIPPDEARKLIVPTFEEFLRTLSRREEGYWWSGKFSQEPVEAEISAAPRWGAGPGDIPIWGNRYDGRIAGIFSAELDPGLCKLLIDRGLAVPAIGINANRGSLEFSHWHPADFSMDEFMRKGGWLAMHRDLAWIYKCQLSEVLANHNRLTLATDQVDAHAAASGLSITQLALGGVAGQAPGENLATTFGLTAIRAVVPKNLNRVPVDKITLIRERYGDQFDAWRDYVDHVGAELAEQLADVESPSVLHAYLDEAARKYVEAPVDQLRKGLASVGIDTLDAALNTKFETPAALATAGLATGNPVAVAAGAAVGIAELRRSTRNKARAELASPHSYLLNVKERLTPQSWIKRVMASMRAAAGLRG